MISSLNLFEVIIHEYLRHVVQPIINYFLTSLMEYDPLPTPKNMFYHICQITPNHTILHSFRYKFVIFLLLLNYF